LIDARAVVAPNARVHETAYVGPYAIIGADVEVGARTRVEGHAFVKGPTTIGEDNHIFQFASIGDDPQDKKYSGEPTRLVIGNRNTIREYCTINRGTVQDQSVTRVGDDNWLMAYTHIAHDCVVGNHTIFANNASIAGHVMVDDYAILGGFTAVHQFCRLGTSSFCALFSAVTKDVPAWVTVSGQPAEPRSINTEGLKRRGFTETDIRTARDAYKVLYRQGLSLEEAVEALAARLAAEPVLKPFVESLRAGSRGLVR
jgi:UDP-N-acetylglucosamine acyltransferase